MKNDNIIQQKSFDFAVRILRASHYLANSKKEYEMSRQLFRSGTSIGANVEESIGAYSKADFLHKLSIAYKEARETKYWIKLLQAGNFLGNAEATSLLNDVIEICRILAKIQITGKRELKEGAKATKKTIKKI